MDKKFLFQLLDAFGPSGYEEEALEVFSKRMKEESFDLTPNAYNNCICEYERREKKVLIVGHIDEVGFMVSAITESGNLRVKPIGGVDPYILLGSKVKILNSKNKIITGIFGSTAIHLLDMETREIELKDLYIDIGAKDMEDVEKTFSIEIGSPIVFGDKRVNLGNNLVATKAADDRLGVFIASEVALNCKGSKVGVIAGITCQEENGLIGARMLSSLLEKTTGFPDYSIVVDVTHSTDYPGVSSEEQGDIKLGKGPVLAYGSVNNKGLVNTLRKLAKEKDIPIQINVDPRYSGTDADELHLMNGGNIPTIVVSIPLRYMHTQNEIFSLDDVQSTIDLLTAFVENLEKGNTKD